MSDPTTQSGQHPTTEARIAALDARVTAEFGHVHGRLDTIAAGVTKIQQRDEDELRAEVAALRAEKAEAGKRSWDVRTRLLFVGISVLLAILGTACTYMLAKGGVQLPTPHHAEAGE